MPFLPHKPLLAVCLQSPLHLKFTSSIIVPSFHAQAVTNCVTPPSALDFNLVCCHSLNTRFWFFLGDLMIHRDILFHNLVSQSLSFLFPKEFVFSLSQLSAPMSSHFQQLYCLLYLNFECVITKLTSYYF